jgi:hypothetical protein
MKIVRVEELLPWFRPDDQIPAGNILTESYNANNVGRKYQHIEDLVLSHGSLGGLHATERLLDIVNGNSNLEIKWDGMPVIIWGRDESGRFMMIPKYAFEFLKRGETKNKNGIIALTRTPEQFKNYILNTGKDSPENRQRFADSLISLWPYLEKCSPKSGFLEGSLLFYPGNKPDGSSSLPTPNKKTNTYDFKPNITTFHVDFNSELGQRIKNAKAMIACTGYYSKLGVSQETRYPDANKLSTKDIIILGTTYIQNPLRYDTKILENLKNFIETRSDIINNYLKSKGSVKSVASELYTYLNKHKRIEGLVKDFPNYVNAMGPDKAQALLNDKQGYVSTLGAIEALSKQKNNIIKILDQMKPNGVSQTNPEGYAQSHPNKNFDNDIPGQFVKLVNQSRWTPGMGILNQLKEGVENKNAVLGWGRGMGHTGHDALVTAVIYQAIKTKATPFFFVSRTFGIDDPIPPEIKISMYQKKFPKYKQIFNLPDIDKPSLSDVLQKLSSMGYKNVTLVVGQDQKDQFMYLTQPTKGTGMPPYKNAGLDNLIVMSRQDTKAPGSDPTKRNYHEGPRATDMREVLLNTNIGYPEQFRVWRSAMSKALSDDDVKQLMNTAKENMMSFSRKSRTRKHKIDTKPKGRKLKELVENIKKYLPNATPEQKKMIYERLLTAKRAIVESKSNDYLPEK